MKAYKIISLFLGISRFSFDSASQPILFQYQYGETENHQMHHFLGCEQCIRHNLGPKKKYYNIPVMLPSLIIFQVKSLENQESTLNSLRTYITNGSVPSFMYHLLDQKLLFGNF